MQIVPSPAYCGKHSQTGPFSASVQTAFASHGLDEHESGSVCIVFLIYLTFFCNVVYNVPVITISFTKTL